MSPKPGSGARNKTTKQRERGRRKFGEKLREQKMRGKNKGLLVRAFILGSHRSSMNSFSRRLHENLISNPSKTSHPSKSLSSLITKSHFSTPSLQLFQRALSSSSGASNIVLVKSDEELNSGLKNVQEKCSPAVFYFTATWCGPSVEFPVWSMLFECSSPAGKFISPVIEELSKKYPHATIYKVDIDTEGLQNALAKLHVAAVPTLDFYKNGKKETTIVGADVAKLKNTMDSLYR
ncbi:hypothetical protein SADUNF_Sadunf01G0137700 [Salix dunnii]|uniref:Thioredoxin domain-containing protein n=1 Tax=Salix dunnii TaxID=1413687 RepID=A0A835NBK3_9ROSI|nr:hypothetical protein SADUNF_Sadunf01G0137700 [Salix dunnii]